MESQLRRTQPSLFVSDNIKVASNLSLDFGIRWEPFLPPVDNLNDQICLDPTFTKRSQFYPNAPPGILFPGSVVGAVLGTAILIAPAAGSASVDELCTSLWTGLGSV